MSAVIDQKAYLQKYLGGKSDKKKKKKRIVKGKGLKIVDDDIDISKLRPLDCDELDFLGQGEDAPQIAGIIDERPDEIKKSEQFNTSSKWRVVNQDDGFNDKLQIREIKKDVKEVQKENALVFGKMYSDSEDENANNSDLSPVRKRNKTDNLEDEDGDLSPPRKKNKTSLESKRAKDKPSRWGPENMSDKHKSSSDESPPRKTQKHTDTGEKSESRRTSVPSQTQYNRQTDNFDIYPLNKEGYRETKKTKHHSEKGNDRLPFKKHSHKKHKRKKEQSDSDLSPRRERTNKRDSDNDGDSDLSPIRKRRVPADDRVNESPPPSNRRMEKTLSGKMAGLQDAKQLRQENELHRRKEEEAFRKMDERVSGRNAQVVSRKHRRDNSEERRKQKEKAERQKVLDEKYKMWSRGLKQAEDMEARIQDFAHESSKPLARHKDDKDLEDSLKRVEREGDPMLQYIRDKKRQRGELMPEKPTYKGSFAPNRFNIRPGYRWDGVDRSNGYETKYFKEQSKRKAQEEEAHKWSTEDL